MNYCFRCGQRVGAAASCWYCGATTQRVVRPSRHCPFCDEIIQAKAIKCPHCAEYLDGRKKEKTVELDVRPGREPRVGPAPRSAPGAPAPRVPQGLAGPRRLALSSPDSPSGPTPDDRAVARTGERKPDPRNPDPRDSRGGSGDSTVDIEAISIHQSKSEIIDLDDPLPIVGETLPPALRDMAGLVDRFKKKTPAKMGPKGPPATRGGAAALPAKRGWFFGRGGKKAAPDFQDVETANPEDRYRVCSVCATEILANDSYCYHCRARYGEEFSFAEAPAGPRSNIVLHALTLALIAAFMAGPAVLEKFGKPDWSHAVVLGAAIGAPLLASWAFLRKRGLLSRLVSLIFFAASIAALYVEFGPS